MGKKKPKYTTRQYGQAAAVCLVLIVIGVVLPWYQVVTPYGTHSQNGTEDPFLGVWVIVLSALGAVAAGVYGFSIVRIENPRPMLGISTLLYFAAWVLTLMDLFRDVPTYAFGGATAMKAYGVFGTSSITLLALICAGVGLAQHMREEEEKSDAEPQGD